MNKLKLRKTHLLFIFALITLAPFLAMKTNALAYVVNISQDPAEVYAGEMITVTAVVVDMEQEEEIDAVNFYWKFPGATQIRVAPEEDIPMLENVLTFIFGPFAAGDTIQYKLYIYFHVSTTEDYNGIWYTVNILEGSQPALDDNQLMYVGIGVAVFVVLVVAVVIIVIKKKR